MPVDPEVTEPVMDRAMASPPCAPRVVLYQPVSGRLDSDFADSWLKSLQQGGLSWEVLSVEISSLAENQLKALHRAAVHSALPKRKRAIAILAYLRGVRREQLSEFLGISLGTFFRYWRTFRESGADSLLTRKIRSDTVAALLHPSFGTANQSRRMANMPIPSTEAEIMSRALAG
jgi:hypothetical protein